MEDREPMTVALSVEGKWSRHIQRVQRFPNCYNRQAFGFMKRGSTGSLPVVQEGLSWVSSKQL